jgi:hypothetical protein
MEDEKMATTRHSSTLQPPPPAIADRGTVRLGGGVITAEFPPRRRPGPEIADRPPLRRPGPEIADRGTVRLGGGVITAEFPPRRRRRRLGS